MICVLMFFVPVNCLLKLFGGATKRIIIIVLCMHTFFFLIAFGLGVRAILLVVIGNMLDARVWNFLNLVVLFR